MIDDTAAKVILAIENGDSIHRVPQHLHTPYETVRQAVNRLEEAGYVRYDAPSRKPTSSRSSVIGRSHSRGLTPSTCGPRVAIRSVATRRLSFLAVREQDVVTWEAFFESFALPTAFERQPRDELTGPLQIILDPQPSLEIDRAEGNPVIPRAGTIEYMREHYVQFQSALAMLDRMYDLDLGVTYRETDRG